MMKRGRNKMNADGLYPLPIGMKIVFSIVIMLLEIVLWHTVIYYFTHTKELEKRYWGKNRKWLEGQIGSCVIAGMALIVLAIMVLRI
jgi:hypothetical protein